LQLVPERQFPSQTVNLLPRRRQGADSSHSRHISIHQLRTTTITYNLIISY
jgi:hypothetical protein